MDDKSGSGESRRDEIRRRLAAIRTRMDELRATRPDAASPATASERIASAQRQAAASQAAAERAIAASARAFRRAAEAHEHAARRHERAAAAGLGDKDQHERQAARHRAAAVRDAQRANQAQSRSGSRNASSPDRSALVSTLRASVSAGESGPVITLSGETDISTVAELSELVTGQLSGGTLHLTLDASGLSFADSASVRVLVLAARTLQQRGGGLVLLRPQRVLVQMLEIMGADQVIIIGGETQATPEPEP